MTTFFFVRHALTAYTGRKLAGWLPDVHLTEEGRSQAEALAERLAHVNFKAVYASPIERTMETAEPIAARHNLTVKVRPTLGEVGYGKWTNRSIKTLTRTKMWWKVKHLPSAVRFPEGESLREVQARAVEEVETLHARHRTGAVCCVCHADVIKLIIAHYVGTHIDLFQRIFIGPASVSVIALRDEGPTILCLNSFPSFEELS